VTFEALLENNPLRGCVRELYEVRPLRQATDVGVIPRALHIECKDGRPTALILKHFSITKMSAIDRDGRLIAAARRRSALGGVEFSTGDVLSLDFADDTFDAVFDLAELHNYADWERGLLELRRVLRPGGLLVLEEISRESFARGAGRIFKLLTRHPYDTMFTADVFRDKVRVSGFDVLHFEERNQFGLLRYFLMIARRAR
jgi:SAM-dependent methyltransferase